MTVSIPLSDCRNNSITVIIPLSDWRNNSINVIEIKRPNKGNIYFFRNILSFDPFNRFPQVSKETLIRSIHQTSLDRFQQLFRHYNNADHHITNKAQDILYYIYSRKHLAEMFKNKDSLFHMSTFPKEFVEYLKLVSDDDQLICLQESFLTAKFINDSFFINQYDEGMNDGLEYFRDKNIAGIEKAFLVFSHALALYEICINEFNSRENKASPVKFLISTITFEKDSKREIFTLRLHKIVDLIVKSFASKSNFTISRSSIRLMIRCTNEFDIGDYTFGHIFEITLHPKETVHSIEPAEAPPVIAPLHPRIKLSAKNEMSRILQQEIIENEDFTRIKAILKLYPDLAIEPIQESPTEETLEPLDVALRLPSPRLVNLLINTNVSVLYTNPKRFDTLPYPIEKLLVHAKEYRQIHHLIFRQDPRIVMRLSDKFPRWTSILVEKAKESYKIFNQIIGKKMLIYPEI